MGNRFSEEWAEHLGDLEGENKTDRSGDEYFDYMWEKMIAKDRPDLTPKDDEYKALKAQTYKAWKEHWHETSGTRSQ